MNDSNIIQTKNRFPEGTLVFHKATLEKCVVIEITPENLVKVRTQNNIIDSYYPQELETAQEKSNRIMSQIPKNHFDNLDPYGI